MDQSKYGVELDTPSGAPAVAPRASTLAHVSPGYFAAFGTTVIAGRDFSPADVERGKVLIVNQSFAHFVFDDRNCESGDFPVFPDYFGYFSTKFLTGFTVLKYA